MKRGYRKHTDLGSALERIVGKLDRKSGGVYTSARVSCLWDEAAGPVVAKHTTGAHLRDGALIVYVDASAWAMELAAMAETYRNLINSELGKETVREIRFTVSRKVIEGIRLSDAETALGEFYREDDVPSVALTDTERAQVEASASVIPDEALREAAVSATVKDLEWKKGIATRNSREKAREGS